MQACRSIGPVELPGAGVLAPTCGVLDLPMRLAYRRFGAALSWIGAIDAQAVADRRQPGLINVLGRQEFTCPAERPVGIQLIGSQPHVVAEAAVQVEPMAALIDLNFSGPLRATMDRGMGAALLRDGRRMAQIVQAVVRRVRAPVTVKLRAGLRRLDIDIVALAQACRDAGAAAVTIHARTAGEGYSGPPHWEAIGAVKQRLDIPVIGNGGVRHAADAQAMMQQTGCDFVMVCTAAFVNPLIFRQMDALLDGRPYRRPTRLAGLAGFMREYFRQLRQVEHAGRRKALKKAVRQFLGLRSYMGRLQTGAASFGELGQA